MCPFRELMAWLYQHSNVILSQRVFENKTRVEHYAVLPDNVALVITSTRWAEIYALKSLNKTALLRVQLNAPAHAVAFDENTFCVLSDNGSVRFFAQEKKKPTAKFLQTASQQLNIQCKKLFGSMLTVHGKPVLVVLADDKRSVAFCTPEEIAYLNIDLARHASSPITKMSSDPSQDCFLLSFEDKSLASCRLEFAGKYSSKLTSFPAADLHCLNNNCLATVTHEQNHLHLHDLHSKAAPVPIELENRCEQLCLNATGEYVFALVQPRVLCMFRVKDRRRLGRLFVYDRVRTMSATDDYIVLSMNDRRLLTLLIADPDDPLLPAKIEALPSR